MATFESTVGLIYETVADPTLWAEVTRTIGAEVGATAAWMFQPGQAGPTFFVLDGLSDAVIGAYAAHYHRADPLVRAWQRRPDEFAGRALRERDLVDERSWLHSEMYNDLCAPNCVGQILTSPLSPGTRAKPPPILSFFRPPGATLFSEQSVRLFERLLPHLQRAVRLREAAAGQRAAVPNWTVTLLDQMPSAIFLLHGTGRVLHANAAGEAIVSRHDGLALRDGTLVACQHNAAQRLNAVLSASLSARAQAAELLIPRLSGGVWFLSVCPLPATSLGFTQGEASCRAWVSVNDAGAEHLALPERLRSLFGLTFSERRVAAGLLAGKSATELAEGHGVSLATVRTQIQSVFGKLGVRRQAEVVRILGEVARLPSTSYRPS